MNGTGIRQHGHLGIHGQRRYFDSAKQDRLQLSFIPDDRTSRLTNTAESGSGLRRAEPMKSRSSVDKGCSGPF
jgi:hypothetical protein